MKLVTTVVALTFLLSIFSSLAPEAHARRSATNLLQRREERKLLRMQMRTGRTPTTVTRRRVVLPRTPRKRPTREELRTLREERRNARRLLVEKRKRTSTSNTNKESITETNRERFRKEVLELTNLERTKKGLSELTYNETIEIAAQLYAQDMVKRNFFDHESPEGTRSSDRMRSVGYGNVSIENCNCRSFSVAFGENLAKGQITPTQVVKDWMNSPDHRENILNPHFKEIGIGIFEHTWVQNFGSIELKK